MQQPLQQAVWLTLHLPRRQGIKFANVSLGHHANHEHFSWNVMLPKAQYTILSFEVSVAFSASCPNVTTNIGAACGHWVGCSRTRPSSRIPYSRRLQSEPHTRRQRQLCVLIHRECTRTAPRRGWKTINTKAKKTSLNNLGCRKAAVCVCVCVTT